MIFRLSSLLLCLLAAGCGVHRQLVIDTEPQGARVFMDREDIGVTPIRLDYEYGGVREFLILHEEGEQKYTPVRVRQDTSEFFLDQFPFDVFTRMAPVQVDQEVKLEVSLETSQLADQVMDDEESYVKALLHRADGMRERARKLQDEGEPAAPPFLPPLEGEKAEHAADEAAVPGATEAEPVEKP